MATPGMLYVTMEPRPGLPPAQFHEWYNNEHGPTRLRLPAIFSNGLRFRATDGQTPSYLASYDVTRMSHLETETYTTLRAHRSPREADTIAQVDVARSFYDLVSTREAPGFVPLERLTDDQAEGTVLLAIQLRPKTPGTSEAEIQRWLDEEHVDMISKVPGFLRARVLRTSALETAAPPVFLGLVELAKTNGLGGPEHSASLATPWALDVLQSHAEIGFSRTYSLFYVFGPAPRDLESLSQLEQARSSFESADGRTKTSNDPEPVLESYITRPDGLVIPYRLEGNPDPQAPTLAFCNSLLTSLHMWDPVVAILKAQRPQYRILRYDARGRHAVPSPPAPATLDMHADDLVGLLDALRIPALHALVGVSMGGATSLRFALRHPSRAARFVACDFNAVSSAANTQAWRDRIATAEAPPGEDGRPGIATLAGQTVGRWFHPASMEREGGGVARWMTDMVAGNDVQGFRYGCQALWDYDMREDMRACEVPGLLVVGEGDAKGALVKAMDGFKGSLGKAGGAELAIVPAAGHLPMVEAPGDFWKAVEHFL